MINVRQKGAGGEREVADAMNFALYRVRKVLGYPESEIYNQATCVQRNQNQSAVGGQDLVNTLGLCIEVKRQEQLSINTWWAQCVESADRVSEHPVLLYRQNGKKWKCLTLCYVEAPNKKFIRVRAEFDWEQFLSWWELWAKEKLESVEVRAA